MDSVIRRFHKKYISSTAAYIALYFLIEQHIADINVYN